MDLFLRVASWSTIRVSDHPRVLMRLGTILHQTPRDSSDYPGDCAIRRALLTRIELAYNVIEIHYQISPAF